MAIMHGLRSTGARLGAATLSICLLPLAGCVADTADVQRSSASVVVGSTGTFVRKGSAKCLDVSASGTADGTRLQQYTCNGTGAQSFRVQDAGGGQVNLVNTNAGKCVDVDHSGSADGTHIQLWTCNGTAAQAFTLESAG